MEITLEDRFLGCIYGLAIGDALGYPVEFMKKSEIEGILGSDGVTGFDSLENPLIAKNIRQPIGSYSDDTQMSLATARGIINPKTEKVEDIMENICKEYIIWYKSPENNRVPGVSCCAGVRNLIAGKHWEESGVDAKGCGAAMRTAPIGLYYFKDPRKIYPLALYTSGCTHKNSTAISAGIGTASLVNLALREYSPDRIATRAENLWGNCNEEFNNKIKQMNEYRKSAMDQHNALSKLGQGWMGHEAVAMALYCFLKNPNDYVKTVLMATNIDGDSDSVASIAGALSGAYNGIQSIPKKWITRIENKDLLEKTAKELFEKAIV